MTEFSTQVVLGESLTPVGQLRFTQTGPRQFSIFTYDPAWVKDPRAFTLQPDMHFEADRFMRRRSRATHVTHSPAPSPMLPPTAGDAGSSNVPMAKVYPSSNI